MLDAVRNAFRLPDLRQKLLYTFLILVAYRLAAHIPLPGVNREVLDQIFRSTDQNILLSLLNFFSGGALAQFSVMAMGVYPYITATIIMQLLTPIVPQLEELSREGEQGRQQDRRQELRRGDQAEIEGRAGQLPGQRIDAGALHPGADQRDGIAGEVEAVIAVGEDAPYAAPRRPGGHQSSRYPWRRRKAPKSSRSVCETCRALSSDQP